MTEHGFGAFCVPFVTISDTTAVLKPTKQIDGKWIRDVVTISSFSDCKILVTDDGFFGVIGMSKLESLKMLNLIFANSLFTMDFLAKVASNLDLIEFEHNSEKTLTMGHMKTTQRNVISFERDTSGASHRVNRINRTQIKIETTKQWVDGGHDLSKTNFVNDVLLLAEGFTFVLDEQYRAAFLYCWMLIETFVDELWQDYAKSLERTSNEKKDLFSHRNWFVYHQIEVFSFIGKMNKSSRDILTTLRKKRNEVIHAKQEITEKEAIDCLVVAQKIIENRINGKEPFYNIE